MTYEKFIEALETEIQAAEKKDPDARRKVEVVWLDPYQVDDIRHDMRLEWVRDGALHLAVTFQL